MNETTDITGPTLVAVSQLPGGVFFRVNSGLFITQDGKRFVRGTSQNGVADILGGFRGRGIALETKTRRGKQEKSQRVFQGLWERSGNVYIIARSPEDAVSALQAL